MVANQEEKLIDKYGSIKAAPIKVGPCKEINPVVGTKNALVLLTEFRDIKHSVDTSYFQELLFSKGNGSSLRDYYLEASYNQLDIKGTVHDQWYTASRNLADYIDKAPVKGDFPRAMKLVEETVHQAKSSEIDFESYARDGKIELLMIIYAGEGMDTDLSVKTIWPHQDRLNEPIEVQEGIYADRYVLVPEYPPDDLGCICHETGHLLGLPDFYNNYSPVVGSWCIMGAGGFLNGGKTPAHPSAWCKIHLGWKEPKMIQDLPSPYEVPAIIDEEGIIYKVEVDGSNGREYFLLENRQKRGFDSYLPDSGLLIWHVNEDNCVLTQPNTNPEHLFITLEQSDGKDELQMDKTLAIKESGLETAKKDLMGDEGDAYPGITSNRTFDGNSQPNSDTYEGDKSQVSVTSISDSAPIMKAEIGVENQQGAPHPGAAGKKNSDFILRYLISLMNSQRNLTSYEEGYEAGKKDAIEKLKQKLDLNGYADSYRQGYTQGYKTGSKKHE